MSGKPKRLNLLPGHDMFLLEGHTRPAMKQAKSISTEKGIYSCSLLLSKETGKIIATKDKSCAAGKRGFCKHITALAYKLVEANDTGFAPWQVRPHRVHPHYKISILSSPQNFVFTLT